jgi:HAMP domain-containing protein
MSTTAVLALLTVVLVAVVVVVLAAALMVVRRGLERISAGLATLAGALETVEAEHLRPLEGAVTAINGQFDVILGALPGIASKAAIVAERRPR